MRRQPEEPDRTDRPASTDQSDPTDHIDRRSLIKVGAKVLPALALVGLATTAVAPPARADCFPANCKAVCADNCTNDCTGDCMGSCRGGCGGCDNTCTHSNG